MSFISSAPPNVEDGATVRDTAGGANPAGESQTLVGRYRMVRELGRGGMGLVMLAHDTLLDVPVAVKVVPEVVVRDSEGIGDLKKEVLRGMELTHPNIVRVFSFEQDAETALIVMEHVEGETLAQKKMQKAGRCFDCEEILPWVEQLCGALDYAHHEAKIAHRDLKPGNLLVTSAGRLKIADFGIASSLSETLTRVSIRVDTAGTPPYMSPQQAMGERPSHLDDIYSLGATIYELLTGKPPFFRGNILAQVMQEEAVPMMQRRAELGVAGCAPIPEAWERTVAACLAKHPAARPASGMIVLAMLKEPGRCSLAVIAPPADMKLDVFTGLAGSPMVGQRAQPPAILKPARLVRRSEFSLRPLFSMCGSLVAGTFELVGWSLRWIIIVALAIGALWGTMILKQKWDEGEAKRQDAAAKKAAAGEAASAAAAPLPAAAAPSGPPAAGDLPPRMNALERGPYRPGAAGPRPPHPPPRR